jgi:glutamyl-tRNA synthetase
MATQTSPNGIGVVRTRIAPSPTGDPHVGTAYVALVNLCFARKHGGQFILRIEDTDRARSTPESEQAILDALHWLGLNWDEGPDIGGPHGPYRQSERSALYQQYAQQLIDQGDAFRCFCTPERLDAMRAAQRASKLPSAYDGHCLALTGEEAAAKLRDATPFVVRMKVPREGVCVIDDLLRDEPIVIPWSDVDMQVLLKSDGFPTYHLANVVDDHLMQITHVMRGEEWISSAPKHKLLYEYFGWEMPKIGHLPLLRNADANKSKLSKRKSATGILFFKRMGYLPEALLNFLGILAFPPPEGHELASFEELVERADLAHIPLTGPVFDTAKLDWLNARYLRERLSPQQLLERLHGWLLNDDFLSRIAVLAQARIERLSDFIPASAYLFAGRLDVPAALLREGKLTDDELRKAYQFGLWAFEDVTEWTTVAIGEALTRVGERMGKKPRDVIRPFYTAIAGSPTALPLYDSVLLLGRDLTRERLRAALATLGTPSNRELDEWRREWQVHAPAKDAE